MTTATAAPTSASSPQPSRDPYELRLSRTQRAFVEDPRRFVAFVGGVGSGKSYAGAVRALRRIAGADRPQLGIVVAPTYPMLRDATLRTALDVWRPLVASVVASEMRVVLRGGHEVLFRSADDPEKLRGPNASWAWLDEAASCHPQTWPITIGRLRQHGAVGDAWVTTTPRGMNWIFEAFVTNASDDTSLHRAATWANPFVDPAFVESLRGQYSGEFARQELEAEFVADSADALLQWAWLDAAKRPAAYDPDLPVQAGVDVAGPGDDETVLCIRQADAILSLRAYSNADARGPVVAALRRWQDKGLESVVVDSAGMGHYYALALSDAGLPVVPVNVGEAPKGRTERETEKAKRTYANLRAQVFWSFREWAEGGMLTGLTDQQTLNQLVSIKYSHDVRGRIAIEKKDDARARGVKSPDRAEAVVLAFWQPPRSGLGPALAARMAGAPERPTGAPATRATRHEGIAEDRAFKAVLERFGLEEDADG